MKFKKKRSNQEMVLSITSMADIFTILLVFLLKSFSTGVSTISPGDSIVLPEVDKADPVVDTLKMQISPFSVVIDDKTVLNLNQFQFKASDLDSKGLPSALSAVLREQRNRDTLKKFPKILVLADEEMPYSTLKRLLASANEAGFIDYKLVVVNNQ